MNLSDIKVLKDQVEYFLRNEPVARDSDAMLTLKIWSKWYPANLNGFSSDVLNGDMLGALANLRELPSQDNIKRARAAFNQQGKYYPTNWQIAKRRGIEEDKWRIAMGYPPKQETSRPTRAESYMDPQRIRPATLL